MNQVIFVPARQTSSIWRHPAFVINWPNRHLSTGWLVNTENKRKAPNFQFSDCRSTRREREEKLDINLPETSIRNQVISHSLREDWRVNNQNTLALTEGPVYLIATGLMVREARAHVVIHYIGRATGGYDMSREMAFRHSPGLFKRHFFLEAAGSRRLVCLSTT